jgi:hypothetical protein
MRNSFRRLLGFGVLGVMLAMVVPTFAAPQHGKKSSKKGGKGSKGSVKKGGGKSNK